VLMAKYLLNCDGIRERKLYKNGRKLHGNWLCARSTVTEESQLLLLARR
jgi:hypothetical protein